MNLSLMSFLSPLSLFVISSCAGTPQSRELFERPGDLPRAYEIQNVPFVEQTDDHCGPASLAMVARFTGHPVTLDELGRMLFTPGKRGTLQADLTGGARRLGLLAVSVHGLRALLQEVSAEHPVIVLQNLGSSANPLWHYAVVIGFDLGERNLVLHSGKNERIRMGFSQFERAWKKADHWALLVASPRDLSVTASLRELLWAASSLERVEKSREANETYHAILRKWPDTAAAYFGLGNTYAALNDYSESAKAFSKASQLEPQSSAAWHNLAEVYRKLQKFSLAERASENARRLDASVPPK